MAVDWKDVGKKAASMGASLIGGVLAGPVGAEALGGVVANALGVDSKPDAVMNKLTADPDAIVKIKQIESTERTRLIELQMNAVQVQAQEETKQISAVNTTMQAEAKAEKWPQYSWRPFNGFCFPLAVILIYFVLPLIDKAVPDVPQWVWLGWLSILGVAAYSRGRMQRVAAGENVGAIANVINSIQGNKGGS